MTITQNGWLTTRQQEKMMNKVTKDFVLSVVKPLVNKPTSVDDLQNTYYKLGDTSIEAQDAVLALSEVLEALDITSEDLVEDELPILTLSAEAAEMFLDNIDRPIAMSGRFEEAAVRYKSTVNVGNVNG